MELDDNDDVSQEFKDVTLELNEENTSKVIDEKNAHVTSSPKTEAINSDKKLAIKSTEGYFPKENASDYFTFRQNIVEDAVHECCEHYVGQEDGTVLSVFLLTEITLWGSDKERLILLTSKTLLVVKYDFIAMKRVSCKKVPLNTIDLVIVGDLVYPPRSIVPHLNAFMDGLSGVQSYFFDRGRKDLPNIFLPRNLNMHGVRLMWNKGKPLEFLSKWNPLSGDVPFGTFTYHPLFFCKDYIPDEKVARSYDVDEFIKVLSSLIEELQQGTVKEEDIILESYIGISSLIHNRNALGFFKFAGRWYEIERSFYLMELTSTCTILELNETSSRNQIKVLVKATNRWTGTSSTRLGTAIATRRDPSLLQYRVDSFLPNSLAKYLPGAGYYQVLDTDYDRFAILWTCSTVGVLHTDQVWILGRDKEIEAPLRIKIYDFLHARQIDSDRLVLPKNSSNCTDE